MKYIVFGCLQDLFTEEKHNDIRKALRCARLHSSHEFKAKVFDVRTQKFIR